MPDAVTSRDISSVRLTLQEGQDETPATEAVRAFLALAHERIMLVKEVEAKGGRVVVLPDIPGARTTSIIERVRNEGAA